MNRPRYWLLKETGNFRTDGTRLPAIYRCTDAALLSGSRACLCSSWAKENTKTTAAGLTAQSPLLLSRLSPRSFTLLHATLDFFFVPFFLYTYLVLPLACFDLRFCYIHIYIFCPVGSGSLRELFFLNVVWLYHIFWFLLCEFTLPDSCSRVLHTFCIQYKSIEEFFSMNSWVSSLLFFFVVCCVLRLSSFLSLFNIACLLCHDFFAVIICDGLNTYCFNVEVSCTTCIE